MLHGASLCSAVSFRGAGTASPPYPPDSGSLLWMGHIPPPPPWSRTSSFVPAYGSSSPTASSPPTHPPHTAEPALRLSVGLPAQNPQSALQALPLAHPSAAPPCPHTTSRSGHTTLQSSLCQYGCGFQEGRVGSDSFQRPQDLSWWALHKSLVRETTFEARGSGEPGQF